MQAIKDAINQYFELFTRHELKGPRPDIVDKYNRRTLTLLLVKLFESMVNL